MDKIKIVFYIDSFMIGGMHRQVLYLVKNINKNKFEPIVITTGEDGGLKEKYIETGCKLYSLGWKGGFDIKIAFRLRNILRKEKVDVVFISEPQNLAYYRLAKLFYKKRIVQIGSFRAMTFWLGHLSYLHKVIDVILSKFLYLTSSEIVVNSTALQKHYSSIINVKPNKQIKVINNGSDFEFESSIESTVLREELGVYKDEIVIVMVARLDPWKDFDTLLKAAKILMDTGAIFKILILGDGILKKNLLVQIDEFGLKDYVFLLGEKKNVVDYVDVSDIVVLSTHGEGFSNSILEGMSRGKPIVATNVGGNAELIGETGECGVLVPPKSPVFFADVLLELIIETNKRNLLGRNAKKRIYDMCNIKKYTKLYEVLFEEVIKKNR